MLLVAEVLGVKPHDQAVDAFALIEGAMNAMDIKSMLPSLAHPVEIAEVDKELNRGDQILVRTAGRKEVFHHGIFIGRLPEVLEDKNLVVDFWGPPKEGKHGARIRLRTLTEFITMPRQRAAQLAVMRWKRDTQDLREFTATLALTLHKDLKDCSGLYHLLNSNCSHFATWCRTLRFATLIFASPPCSLRCADCVAIHKSTSLSASSMASTTTLLTLPSSTLAHRHVSSSKMK
eukprot:gene2662-biopygen8687